MLRPPPTSTLFPYTTLFRSDPVQPEADLGVRVGSPGLHADHADARPAGRVRDDPADGPAVGALPDRKSTRLNSSHPSISYAVFCLKKKKKKPEIYLSLYATF